MGEQYRPTCHDCGYADVATLTAAQLDTRDFECPRCGSRWFDFPREEAQQEEARERR